MTLLDDSTGMEVAQGRGEPKGAPWTVREGFLEVVTVYTETCPSERSLMAEAALVLVTTMSLGLRRHHTL